MPRNTKLIPLVPILERMGACSAAREWLAKHDRRTFRAAWNAIPPSHWDWASWLISFFSLDPGWVVRDQASDSTLRGEAWSRAWLLRVRREIPAETVERAIVQWAVQNAPDLLVGRVVVRSGLVLDERYTGTLTGSDPNYLYHSGGGGPILRSKAQFVGLA